MSKKYNIAVIPGDGTGPEGIAEGIKVLNAVSDRAGFKLDLNYYDFGGERYLKTGEVLPDNAVEELKKHDVIYLGAIGHPDVKPGVLEKGIRVKDIFDMVKRFRAKRELPLLGMLSFSIVHRIGLKSFDVLFPFSGLAVQVFVNDAPLVQLPLYDRKHAGEL